MSKGAPKGNQYWRLRKDMSEDGRKISVDDLYTKCQEYIDFCRNTPLLETDFRGKDIVEVQVPKMRAMSLWGLYSWLDIVESTWQEWRKDKKYSVITARVENIFKSYKFEGAAAGMLHPNIIARDLGLADKREQTIIEQPLFPEEGDEK